MSVWWSAIPAPLKGTILVLIAMLLFSIMLVQIRMVGQGLPVVMVIMARQLVTQLTVVARAGRAAPALLRTSNLPLQLWRAAFSLGTTVAIYATFVYLPLALASAISFSAVLLVTIGAALILKEQVDARTWAATIIGLAGVYIMLSPTEAGSLPFVLLAIFGAICSAGVVLTVRAVDSEDSLGTVLTYQGVLVFPVLIIPLLLTWETPDAGEWLLLASIGIVGTVAQYAFVAAYRYAEASRLAPLDFVRLVLMAAAGLVFFNEPLQPSLLVGMVIVVLTTLYTVRANTRQPIARRGAAAEPALLAPEPLSVPAKY